MRKTCLECGHVCHCIGQGFFLSKQTCDTCSCVECVHEIVKIIKEDSMVKKIIKRIWKIICWPWNKLMDWLKSSLPKG